MVKHSQKIHDTIILVLSPNLDFSWQAFYPSWVYFCDSRHELHDVRYLQRHAVTKISWHIVEAITVIAHFYLKSSRKTPPWGFIYTKSCLSFHGKRFHWRWRWCHNTNESSSDHLNNRLDRQRWLFENIYQVTNEGERSDSMRWYNRKSHITILQTDAAS